MANIYRSTNDIYMESLELWRNNKGTGTIAYDSFLDTMKPAMYIIMRYIEANPNSKVVIVVPNETKALTWLSDITTRNVNATNIYIYTMDMVIQDKVTMATELLIIDNIELCLDHVRVNILRGEYIRFKYCMGLTNSIRNDGIEYYHDNKFDYVHKVTKLDLITSGLLSDVTIHNVGLDMSDSDQSKYNDYSQFISETIEMYGDFDTIQLCYVGNIKDQVSPDYYRNALARDNGWSNELPLDNDLNVNIDRYFAPSNIYTRCKTFSEYIHFRKRLMTDNVVKVDAICKLVSDNLDKKILIINKRGEFAHTLTTAINNLYPMDSKSVRDVGLFNTNIKSPKERAVEYHLHIPSSTKIDINSGKVFLYKSGVNKGKPKMLGAKAISNLNLKHFENNYHTIICTNNTLIKDMVVNVDLVIITSAYCSTIKTHQYRVETLNFINEPTIVNLYLNDSKESKIIRDNATKSNNNVNFCSIDEITL